MNKRFRPLLLAYTRLTLLVITAALLTNCANESVPQGGEVDKTTPKPLKISPADKSVRFSSNKVKITFNEFIKESGFGQTLVSPPLEKKPDFHVDGRTVTIKFKTPLRDSTTYTINFADDIQDLNEGNKLSNFTYVFSTGDFLDSASVSGTVLIAKDNSPADDVVVSLYSTDSFSAIRKSKPLYFAKTDKTGSYKIEHIKTGRYYIYALKDQNYNYIYDQPNELIAFSDSILYLTDSTTKPVQLRAFEDDRRKLILNESKAIGPGYLQFYYSRPIKTFELNSNFYTPGDFAYFNPTNDTVNYWYSKYYTKFDSVYLLADSLKRDTVRLQLRFIEKDSLLSNPRNSLAIVNQPVKSKMDTSKSSISTLQELNRAVKIVFTRPIIGINDSARLQIIEDSLPLHVEPIVTVDEKSKLFVSVDFVKKENTKYTIQIPDSAFQDIFGTYNKKTQYSFTTNSKDSYGNLRITLKTEHPEKYYVVKLQNAAGEPVKEFYLTGNGERKVSAENILAGGYKFVVIEDDNRNGEWDSGDFKKRLQPEKIFTYKDVYQLKGGWDLDVEVKF